MWMQTPVGETPNWKKAMHIMPPGIKLGGYDSWRLPTTKEFDDLTDPKVEGQATCDWLNSSLSGRPHFSGLSWRYYWTEWTYESPNGWQAAAIWLGPYYRDTSSNPWIQFFPFEGFNSALYVRSARLDSCTYKLTITTASNVNYSGTDAKVFLTIKGMRGSSRELLMDGAGGNFEKGSTNIFDFKLPDYGRLTQVRIRHDNSGSNPGWYVQEIRIGKVWPIEDLTTHDSGIQQDYSVSFTGWLATSEGDKQIDRTVQVNIQARGVHY
jgi:hypothetical protein